MRIGDKLIVESNWSISGKEEEVTVTNIDRKDFIIYIEYNWGYQECLPISAFRGF